MPHGASLSDGETLAFQLLYLGREREGFLLQHAGRLHAYLNECPHWAVDLDMGDGDFFDTSLQRIYCKNHGALFHPDTGVCETGPCLGRALTRLEVIVENADALVRVPVFDLHRGAES